MTKSEYMRLLEENLERFGKELQGEILEDYRQHFAEGEKQGKTEEEIIRELGNIQEMIEELPETDTAGSADTDETEGVECVKNGIYTGFYRAIDIGCDVADIELYSSEDGKIYVEYRNDGSESMKRRYSFYQYEKDGVFCVGVKKNREKKSFLDRFVTVNLHNNAIWMKVKVPKGMEQLALSTSSGDAIIRGLAVGTFKGNTSSGDVQMEDIHADKLEFNTSSGDIHLSHLTVGTFKGSASSGDVELKNMKTDKLECNTVSGDIVLKAIQAKTGTFSVVSGDIEGKEMHIDTVSCETVSGDIDIRTDAKTCQCNTTNGDISVNTEGQDRKLDVNTINGDISVNMDRSGGLEVTVSVLNGDTEICWDGKRQSGVKKGTVKFGEGSCKVSVNSVSGDVSVSAR